MPPSHLTTLRVCLGTRLLDSRSNKFTTPQHPHTNTLTMALLVDKHRPRNLEALSYHPELSDRLRALVRNSNRLPNKHIASDMVLARHKAGIFHIYSSTALLVQARRRASLPLSKSSTVPVSKRSRLTRVSSKLPRTVNSNSTLSPPSTTSRSPLQMLETMTE